MMNGSAKSSYFLLVLGSAGVGVAVWAGLRFTAPKELWRHETTTTAAISTDEIDSDRWARAVAKVKEARTELPDANVGLEVPPELRHYEERRWFLATQVAEVKKHNLHNYQDYLDLAATIQRGEMASVPAVTDDFVLFGVGARADDSAFSRHEGDETIPLLNETELRNEYQRLADARSTALNEISRLNSQAVSLKNRDRAKQRELQTEISARRQQVTAADEEKARLDQFYGPAEIKQKLFKEYEALHALAKSFRGLSYDINNPSDRQALKLRLLSSLRPEALQILKEIASAYHRQFDRPLPVSSLVRPEEYQHVLRRFNRAAVLIDTPPHSTGLAFDIDYRYMSVAEQNFVMAELARLKQAGRIEVLRERGANFHVFAFIDGVRPSDDLVKASLEEVGPSAPETTEAGDATEKSSKTEKKSAKRVAARPKAKERGAKSKGQRAKSNKRQRAKR